MPSAFAAGLAAALVMAGLAIGGSPRVGKPTVRGPRSTTSQRPVFVFSARGAIGFRCSFDSRSLHACRARYSQRLKIGLHTLRVQGIGRGGKRSALTMVRVRVRQTPATPSLPTIPVAATISVGSGPGAPATGFGSVWVPNTTDGTVSRVDPAANAVIATIRYAPAGGGGGGFFDSAAVGHGSVWVASDERALVARISPATNEVTASIPVAARPAQITATSDAVWTAHFLGEVATRIDPATNTPTEHRLPTASMTGAAADGSTVWLLSNDPQTIIHLDTSGHELVHADATPTVPRKRAFLEAWWLAVGEGSVWATHPNQDVVTRSDPTTGALVQEIQVPGGRLFGIAVGGGAAWAVTDASLVQIDPAANRAVAKASFAASSFTGVAIAEGAVWVTAFDRSELYRVNG